MLDDVYILADNVVSPIGYNSIDNFINLMAGYTGIKQVQINGAKPIDTYASLIPDGFVNELDEQLGPGTYTRLEKLLIRSMQDAVTLADIDASSPSTGIIISTTKGNIDLLHEQNPVPAERIYLSPMAKAISKYFKNENEPIVISNACISGVMAIVIGARMIRSGRFEQVIVSGGDIINDFTVSGFLSFKALSSTVCQPFDIARGGLNLGEGIGTVILSRHKGNARAKVLGGAGSNDANHISGPSRDGSGLKIAIRNALKQSGISVDQVDAISAHGTGTPYNDEMEAITFDDLGLSKVPANSMKGYFGHTLGGAGLVESIMGIHAMSQNIQIGTRGYEQHGVSRNINITEQHQSNTVNHTLKTASGFGGCNAAVIFSRI